MTASDTLTGVASNALVLDGVNDYVNVGDKATLENNPAFTFAVRRGQLRSL